MESKYCSLIKFGYLEDKITWQTLFLERIPVFFLEYNIKIYKSVYLIYFFGKNAHHSRTLLGAVMAIL